MLFLLLNFTSSLILNVLAHRPCLSLYVVEDREKKHRAHRLLKLSDEKTRAFYAAHIGQEADVLFEKAARGKAMMVLLIITFVLSYHQLRQKRNMIIRYYVFR